MKKNYITPEINVIQLDTLCGGQLVTASVHSGTTGECVSNFDVFSEKQTKVENKGLWGSSNSDRWGDD